MATGGGQSTPEISSDTSNANDQPGKVIYSVKIRLPRRFL